MSSRPVLVVTLCTAAALGIPCAAWYVTGSRATAQQAEFLRQEPAARARDEARRLAHRLAVRIEALRHSESRRSFLDYSPDPRDSCGAPHASPLAKGPADPLVWAHFQINEVGQLSMPTLDGEHTGSDRDTRTIQQAILDTLECAPPIRIGQPPDAAATEIEWGAPDRVVSVGAFAWQTLPLGDENVLLALREVSTPGATLRQGFVIRSEALVGLVRDSAMPVTIRAGSPRAPTEIRIPVDGDAWTVSIDASAEIDRSAVASQQVLARFRRNFGLGLLAALVGGSLVVATVWQADRLARQRARFAATAAHELRTPLAGLRLYGEMLADGSGDASQAKAYARRIAAEAQRLGRVVSNLLSFSRLERGELFVRCADGDLAPAVRQSVDQLRSSLEANGSKIELSIDASLPNVRFDADAVHQILVNLLDNADKYARTAENRTIRVALMRTESGLTLSVTDNGPGVEPSLRHRLFQPFARVASAEAPEGLGLGLALVEALARAQNARAAYSEEARGACFSITFPVAA